MGVGDKEEQTVGYHYALGMHMVVCLGPVDGIKQMWVGEKCVWPNADDIEEQAADGQVTASIDLPDIFGGEDREGGIVGDIDIQYGGSSQTKNSYLISMLSPINQYIPAFRGVVSVILKQVRVGTSPYLKPWGFLAKRTDVLMDGDTQWYPAKADIDGDMNPVHIIREVLTSNLIGLGYGIGYIDDANFKAVADTLYDEEFGLSFEWNAGSTPVEDFIANILEHIDGVLFQDPQTGLFKIVLARDDYVSADLDTYDEDTIVDVVDFKRELLGSIPNKITVKYSNEAEDKEGIATADDIAMIDLEGGVIPSILDYRGITKGPLAAKVAARELRQLTSMLACMTIIGNRSMIDLLPNSVFKLDWPALGITGLIVRIMQVDYGLLTEGRIKFKVIEDVFLATTAIYNPPPYSGWADPVSEPSAAPARVLSETPYYTLYRSFGASQMANLDDDAGYLGVGAMKPSSDTFEYELLVRDGLTLDFSREGDSAFTPTATLAANLPMNAQDATINLNGTVDLDEVAVNSYAGINDEIVKVLSVDTTLNQIQIARGILDTVPAAHLQNDRIWFSETTSKVVNREYADGEQPGVKILPITGRGKFAEGDATAFNADVFDSRQVRPYPPGDFEVDGVSYPASFSGEPTISWKHRDRTQQTAYLVEHDAGNIGPETNVTYTLRIYDENNVLVRTETGLTETSYTYDELDERDDCGLGSDDPLNTQLRFELWSVRDIYDSWQRYDITVARV